MIEINQLSFRYPYSDKLFKRLNLTLNPGQVCGLLGKNGAGKTSLLKLIVGLVFPTEGHCRVNGQDSGLRLPSVLRDICFLPEDLFVPALAPKEYIKFYAPFYPNFDQAFLQRCLTEFEIPTDKPLNDFSYGQKKKFLISFGLATNCHLFILDEPTNGLDIPSKTIFRKLLASAITDEKLFIISTHQVHDVERLIDTVVILDEGKIILNDTMDKHEDMDLETLFNTIISGQGVRK